MKNIIKTILSIISLNKRNFNSWRYQIKEYNHLKKLLKKVERKQKINKCIVFNPVRSDREFLDREIFLGKLLALNGAKVYILLDDGVLLHWETYQVNNLTDINQINRTNLNPYNNPKLINNQFVITHFYKKNIIKKALKTYRDKNLKIIYYSSVLRKVNLNNWQKLKKHAKSSTIRFFKTSELDYNNKFVKYYYSLSLKNAILSRNVAEFICNNIEPDIFITSHAIYSTWGPPFEYLNKKGVKCLNYSFVHGHSINPKEIFISSGSSTFFLSSCKNWKIFKQKPVTEDMKNKINQYFTSRLNFNTSDTKILYQGKRTSFKVDKNDGYKYHISLFPNVIWDGNICDKHKVFEDYRDWVLSTINFLKNKSNIKLYIKSHPSEITVLKNSPRIVDIITKNIDMNNIDNVILIPPEEIIDTYEFLKSGIDLGLIYDGFLAVEMPFLRIPTIMCVKGGMFAVENGNIIVTSKKEYFDYLDNIEKTLKDFHKNYQERYNNIVRYLYWYIFENAIKLPTLSKTRYLRTNLLQLKQDDTIIDEKLLEIFRD